MAQLIINEILHLWYLLPAFIIVFYSLYTSIVIVGGDDVVMLERRWFGAKIPQGRIFALRNEVGIQARVLTPGLHFLLPFLYKTYKTKLTEILEDEIGVVTSADGDTIEVGRIFAKVITGHNSFQDGEAFLSNSGQKGPQITLLPPGKYRINTKMFTITKKPAIVINSNEIGVVIAEDGVPKQEGSLFATPVDGHNNFQDGEQFLNNGGGKGMQLQSLPPGMYRIHPGLFSVENRPATIVPAGKIGVVVAKDGLELPKDDVVAPRKDGHNSFQNSVQFLAIGGHRGPQLEVLVPATYFINTYLFQIELYDELKVEIGNVAVVTSYVGALADADVRRLIQGSQISENAADAKAEETYVVPEGYRGVLDKYFTPGKYYLNPYAFSHTLVQSTNVTVDWDNQNHTKFDPLKVISKDGFDIFLSVKVIVRVLPEQAPYMVSKSGNMENLIHSVINPNIDASFRNQASSANAIDFLSNRDLEQKKAEEDIRRILSKYHVECVSVLIVQIELPQSLLETKTQKVIADNQNEQYEAQTKAELSRTNLEKQTAFANQQQQLVNSELSITIANNEKKRKITDAEADAEVLTQQGIGQQKKLEAIGKGEASKIEAIGAATASSYKSQCEAVGKEQLFAIEIVKQFAQVLQENPNLKLIPDVYVGGNGSSLDGLFGQLAKSFPKTGIEKMIHELINKGEVGNLGMNNGGSGSSEIS